MNGLPSKKTSPQAHWMVLLALLLAAKSPALEVTILSPPPGEPTFGEVVFEVEVYPADGARRVVLAVDGKVVGELAQPPFRLTTHLSEANRERHFAATAYGFNGEIAEALVVTPGIRVDDEIDAELQQLYVTVSAGDQRILDLDAAAFTIVDNGARQELVTFARGDIPLTAAILIDSSASMRGDKLRDALAGAGAFVRGMQPGDEASMLLFSDRLLLSTPFSSDISLLTSGLGGVKADGGTALYDHLYIALKRLERQQGRRVVILLTDGIDSHSALRMTDAMWLVRRSRALIYWIRTGFRADDVQQARFSAWKDADEYRQEYEQLNQAVLESGGRIVDVQQVADADVAFREILRELREQYVIGYQPNNKRHDGSWHQIGVRLNREDLRVRAQRGYIDY